MTERRRRHEDRVAGVNARGARFVADDFIPRGGTPFFVNTDNLISADSPSLPPVPTLAESIEASRPRVLVSQKSRPMAERALGINPATGRLER